VHVIWSVKISLTGEIRGVVVPTFSDKAPSTKTLHGRLLGGFEGRIIVPTKEDTGRPPSTELHFTSNGRWWWCCLLCGGDEWPRRWPLGHPGSRSGRWGGGLRYKGEHSFSPDGQRGFRSRGRVCHVGCRGVAIWIWGNRETDLNCRENPECEKQDQCQERSENYYPDSTAMWFAFLRVLLWNIDLRNENDLWWGLSDVHDNQPNEDTNTSRLLFKRINTFRWREAPCQL